MPSPQPSSLDSRSTLPSVLPSVEDQRAVALAPLPRSRLALAVLVALAGVLGAGSAVWVAGVVHTASAGQVPREFLLLWPLVAQYALMAVHAAAPSGAAGRRWVAFGGAGFSAAYAVGCAVLG